MLSDIGKYSHLFMKNTLNKNRAIKLMLSRIIKMIGFKIRLYFEDSGWWETYKSDKFDINHYR